DMQQSPSVAMAMDDSFMVVWQSNNQDGDKWGIYAQRYSADGDLNLSGGEGDVLSVVNETQRSAATDGGIATVPGLSLRGNPPIFGHFSFITSLSDPERGESAPWWGWSNLSLGISAEAPCILTGASPSAAVTAPISTPTSPLSMPWAQTRTETSIQTELEEGLLPADAIAPRPVN